MVFIGMGATLELHVESLVFIEMGSKYYREII